MASPEGSQGDVPLSNDSQHSTIANIEKKKGKVKRERIPRSCQRCVTRKATCDRATPKCKRCASIKTPGPECLYAYRTDLVRAYAWGPVMDIRPGGPKMQRGKRKLHGIGTPECDSQDGCTGAKILCRGVAITTDEPEAEVHNHQEAGSPDYTSAASTCHSVERGRDQEQDHSPGGTSAHTSNPPRFQPVMSWFRPPSRIINPPTPTSQYATSVSDSQAMISPPESHDVASRRSSQASISSLGSHNAFSRRSSQSSLSSLGSHNAFSRRGSQASAFSNDTHTTASSFDSEGTLKNGTPTYLSWTEAKYGSGSILNDQYSTYSYPEPDAIDPALYRIEEEWE